MKNLSLFVTLGIISLMGAFTPVNAQDAQKLDEQGNVIMEQEQTPVEMGTDDLSTDSNAIPLENSGNSEETMVNPDTEEALTPDTEVAPAPEPAQ